MKAKIKSEVYESVNQKYVNGNVAIDSSALVIYGEKKFFYTTLNVPVILRKALAFFLQ